MALGWKSARSVNHHDTALARSPCADRVKSHRCGVTALLSNDLDPVAFAPNRKLLAGGCSEGVTRRE